MELKDIEIRKLADQYNIDLKKTGIPENSITTDYIKNYINDHFFPHVLEKKPINGVRKMIADHLVSGLKEAALISLYMDLNCDNFMKARKENQDIPYNVFMLKIIASAINEFPYMNSSIKNNEIITYKEINLGIAVDSNIGLIVPVIRDVNLKSFTDIALEYSELAKRAKKGIIKEIDISGGTFTFSNLGSTGISYFMSIPNWPQTGILSTGKIEQRPVVVDGKIEIHHMMTASVTVDHRAIDGAPAARFLSGLRDKFENFNGIE